VDCGGGSPQRLVLGVALPLDATLSGVKTGDGRVLEPQVVAEGDVRRVRVIVDNPGSRTRVSFDVGPGTEAYVPAEPGANGERSRGLLLVRSRAEGGRLRLVVEGRPGGADTVLIRGPRRPVATDGVTVEDDGPGRYRLRFAFDGDADSNDAAYVRRDVELALQ
jgi:hypothetical protein